jgi:beta-phosphoglucomutase-like phosphatase (HAD superfamily)
VTDAVVFDMDGVLVDSEQVWDGVREELADQMRRDDPGFARGGGGGFSFDAPTSVGLSAPGTEAFKQDFAKWEEMRRQATQVLDNVETALSKKIQAKQARDRLAAGADDKAPAGYQQQVDDYFKAIAGKKKPD